MNSLRKSALLTGVFFIITIVTSIPALILYQPVLNDTHYVLSAGPDTRVTVGAFLEVLLAISGIGTAVTVFPVVRRQSEAIALGYVAARVLESTIIAVGIISVLSVVTLRQGFTGADDAASSSPARRSSPSTSGRSCSGPASYPEPGTGCCSAT
jgi:hypothetical protein